MAFLLDTNVLSELRKGHNIDPKVETWQRLCATSDQWISVISLIEVQIGVRRALRHDPVFAKVLDDWYQSTLLAAYQNRTLRVDVQIVEKRAEYESLRSLNYSDALIAATAHVNHMALVTRNTKDFHDLGIDLINPWEHPLD